MRNTVYTTRPFIFDGCQAIRIPEEFRLDDTEVLMKRIGDSIVITSRSIVKKDYYEGLRMITPDFLSEGRPEESHNPEIVL